MPPAMRAVHGRWSLTPESLRIYNRPAMGRSGRSCFVVTLLVLAAATAACVPLTIGIPATEGGLPTVRAWALICGRVQAASGIEVRYVVLKDHQAVVDELQRRFVDLAVLDPAWYVKERRTLTPLLSARVSGGDTIRVCLIVPRGSIIYKPADLAGHSIALTRAGQSAAGYFVPLALLAQAGIVQSNPGRWIFAETFDSILKGVAFESLEAGAVPSYAMETETGRACADFIRVIGESAPLPQALMVGRTADGGERYRALLDAFLALRGTEEGRQALAQSGYAGFYLPDTVGFDALEGYLRIFGEAYGAPD
jgi:ABC-type phosphate/phosphonate transport system substrate-binding protein